ncbi:MAG: hypothetical protein Q9225_006814 [Loekoesia sp. 1 TL-2023]
MSATNLEKESRIKQAQFMKTVQAGTWQSFLHHDAEATRKSFRTWWQRTFSGSPEAQALSKDVKREIHQILDAVPPSSVDRANLLPDTIRVLETWESIPLVEGTSEHSKAKVRLLRDLAMSDDFKEAFFNGLNQHLTVQELGEARCWLYHTSHGPINQYQSLEQPIRYKDLKWDPVTNVLGTVVAMPNPTAPPNPELTREQPFNPESLRLSDFNFWRFVNGTYPPEGTQRAQLELPQYLTADDSLGCATGADPSQDYNNEDAEEHAMEGTSQLAGPARTSLARDPGRTRDTSVEVPSSSPTTSNNGPRPRSRGSTLSVSEDEGGAAEELVSLWDVPPFTGGGGYNIHTHNGTQTQPIEIQYLPDYTNNQHPCGFVVKREDQDQSHDEGESLGLAGELNTSSPLQWNNAPLFDCDPDREHDSDADEAYMCMPSYETNRYLPLS